MAPTSDLAIRPVGIGLPPMGANTPAYDYEAAVAANSGPSLWGSNGYGFAGSSGSQTTAGFQA